MSRFQEDDLQMAVARYLDYLPNIRWCHVANERNTNIQKGVRLKKKGVKSGVPDILIFNTNAIYNGCAIELKIHPNRTTTNQKYWLESLKNNGWFCAVCYSLEEAIHTIKHYMDLRK